MFGNRVQFTVRFLLLVMLAAGVTAGQFRPRVLKAELQYVEPAETGGLTIRLVNQAPNPIWVYGGSLNSPFYSMEGRASPGQPWRQVGPIGWCGTGAGMHRLSRGADVTFTAWWDAEQDSDITEVRVHLQCFDDAGDHPASQSFTSDPIPVFKPSPAADRDGGQA